MCMVQASQIGQISNWQQFGGKKCYFMGFSCPQNGIFEGLFLIDAYSKVGAVESY